MADLLKVMERERLHSEHAAQCFLDAKRRDSKRKKSELAEAPIEWPRADPAALAEFDQKTKLCTMNCGPHRNDPRTDSERKFLCDDCIPPNDQT